MSDNIYTAWKMDVGVAALERRTGWRGSSLTGVGQAVKLGGEDMIGGDVIELPVVTHSFPQSTDDAGDHPESLLPPPAETEEIATGASLPPLYLNSFHTVLAVPKQGTMQRRRFDQERSFRGPCNC